MFHLTFQKSQPGVVIARAGDVKRAIGGFFAEHEGDKLLVLETKKLPPKEVEATEATVNLLFANRSGFSDFLLRCMRENEARRVLGLIQLLVDIWTNDHLVAHDDNFFGITSHDLHFKLFFDLVQRIPSEDNVRLIIPRLESRELKAIQTFHDQIDRLQDQTRSPQSFDHLLGTVRAVWTRLCDEYELEGEIFIRALEEQTPVDREWHGASILPLPWNQLANHPIFGTAGPQQQIFGDRLQPILDRPARNVDDVFLMRYIMMCRFAGIMRGMVSPVFKNPDLEARMASGLLEWDDVSSLKGFVSHGIQEGDPDARRGAQAYFEHAFGSESGFVQALLASKQKIEAVVDRPQVKSAILGR